MDSYDFIIVGAGASGCLLASRLAKDLPDHSVLLLDAGGKNADIDHQSYGERHWTFMVAPGANWGYKTTPQPQLGGREIDFSRGKGLGGSTAINFCVYTRGPSIDYDDWAKLVGDDEWSWKNALKRFQKLETFHHPPKEYEPFAKVSADAHGFDGPVDVGLTEKWDPSLGEFLKKIYEYQPKNLDHNSGDPLGISICQVGVRDGCRVNAADTFLSPNFPNLTVVTEAPATKILFDGKTATGVEVSGRKYIARREVILSAGSVDSPKLLLLSGVGPSQELQQFGIPLVQELPDVGKNLDDHLYLFMVSTQNPRGHHRTSHIKSPQALEEARKQYQKDKTGPLSEAFLPQMLAFLKNSKALTSKEFEELDADAQKALLADTKPTFEILSQVPNPFVPETESYLSTMVGFNGGNGKGEIRLRSSDPNDHPIIEPNYLSRPVDRRFAIEAVRGTLELLDIPALSKDRTGYCTGPKGSSDEEILQFISEAATSMWHASGTLKMGKPQDPDTCVDTDFKVRGVDHLRVVDMSVAPLLPSAHTQACAYLIGETAADKIVAAYS
ncbi:hypothetical protein ACLMJK_008694 [Lecanora helva]